MRLLGTRRVQCEQREGFGLERGGPRREDDLGLGAGLRVGDVVGQGAEVFEQGPEAVQRQAVIGRLARILGLGVLGAQRLGTRCSL